MGEALGRRIDAIAVVKVDRWARSMQHLHTTVNQLHERGVAFYAADQGLEIHKGASTSTLILGVLGAVAQWEADIIGERTKDALAARRLKGIRGGRRLGFKRCDQRNGCQRQLGHAGSCGVKGVPIRTAQVVARRVA